LLGLAEDGAGQGLNAAQATHERCNGCENLVYNLNSRRWNCSALLTINAIFLAEILNGFGFATIRA
jgi:hypothetical protein